ncbi:MAG TPA: hypothetical protein VMT89_07190 [Candidatus Acidoferrales bacterium]|nr:hypothetical protein [Candidatus Acidoferrales bacterium]
MPIHIRVQHVAGEYELKLLESILNKLERLMALAPEVQSLVDAVTANTNAVAAAVQGLQAEASQITALQAQVTDLQNKLNGGAPIDAADLAAIVQATQTLSATNAQLQTAVPANTTPAST